MGSVVISGATSGAVTLAVPAEAGTRTLTLPAETGTAVVKNGDGDVTLAGALTASTTAKAWVNIDGTGTVAIRDSYNVSSVTDNGTGDYSVNFSVALGDANYSAVASGNAQGGGYDDARQGPGVRNVSLSQVKLYCGFDNGTATDWTYVNCIVFGN